MHFFGFGTPISRYFYACYEWLSAGSSGMSLCKGEGRRGGERVLCTGTPFFKNLMLGIFTLSAISEDSAKDEGGFN
uniref:Uncharacterized protein n=1 Tax=Candidatus Methanophaga sp. ANME-1 ERB7 TaxID=2759913 RepID=A0A7G9Z6Q6_9EURY|nr:hypothetical protein JGNPCJAK_00044 [Methanosarcinales archaeon ANME-1 ERB7]